MEVVLVVPRNKLIMQGWHRLLKQSRVRLALPTVFERPEDYQGHNALLSHVTFGAQQCPTLYCFSFMRASVQLLWCVLLQITAYRSIRSFIASSWFAQCPSPFYTGLDGW